VKGYRDTLEWLLARAEKAPNEYRREVSEHAFWNYVRTYYNRCPKDHP